MAHRLTASLRRWPCVFASMVHLGRRSIKVHPRILVVLGGGGWCLPPRWVGAGVVFATPRRGGAVGLMSYFWEASFRILSGLGD